MAKTSELEFSRCCKCDDFETAYAGGEVAEWVRALDRHTTEAGSIPRCGKGFFSQSQLSYCVRTALVCNHMHEHLCTW